MARPDFCPRFLPDPQLHEEWGLDGVLLYEVIRKGFRVPPTAAWGARSVRAWLETLPSFKKAIESWRLWGNPYSLEWVSVPDAVTHLADLRDEILTAPMPFGFSNQTTVLRERLCGDKAWPIQLRLGSLDRSAVIPDAAMTYEIWSEIRKLVSLQFTLERAVATLSRMEDPRDLSLSIRVQPVLKGGDSELPQDRRKELLRLPKGIEAEWVWDGETLWLTHARLTPEQKAQSAGTSSSSLGFPSGTGAPASKMTMSWIEGFLRDAQVELRSRYGIQAVGLEHGIRLSLDGFVIDPAAMRFERVAPLSQRLMRRIASTIRLGRSTAVGPLGILVGRLAEWEGLAILLRRETDRQLDRDEALVRQWLIEASDLRDANEVDEASQRLISLVRGAGTRVLGVCLARIALYQTLSKILASTSLPALGTRKALRSDWHDLKRSVEADPRGVEWLAARGLGVSLTPVSREKWSRFLQTHGHAASGWDLAVPSIADMPSQIFAQWNSDIPSFIAKGTVLTENAPSREVGALSGPVLARAMGLAHELTALLERHLDLVDLLRCGVRRVVIAGGDILVRKHFIRDSLDVLLLEFHELLSSLQNDSMTPRFLVEARREEIRREELATSNEALPLGLTRAALDRLRASLSRQQEA